MHVDATTTPTTTTAAATVHTATITTIANGHIRNTATVSGKGI